MTGSGAESTRQGSPGLRWRQLPGQLGIYLVVAVLFVIGSLTTLVGGSPFLTLANFNTMIEVTALLGIVAIGASFITYGGHYVDLSIPAIWALSGFACVAALPLGVVPAFLAGLAAGGSIGAINGYVVGYLRVNPIIWTLAMNFALDGVLRWGFSGGQIYPDRQGPAGDLFVEMVHHKSLPPISDVVLVMGVIAVVGHLLMTRTRFGRLIQMTGSDYEVARASGVNVRRMVLSAFLLSGVTTAVAGMIYAGQVRLATFGDGAGKDFAAVTAIVIGGVALGGGVGSIVGVVGGVLTIALLTNIGLQYFDTTTIEIARGVLFIVVVASASALAARAGRNHE